jgi:hypothetical protein
MKKAEIAVALNAGPRNHYLERLGNRHDVVTNPMHKSRYVAFARAWASP